MHMHEETMTQVILQEMNEERFNRKHIDAKIRKEIEASLWMQDKIEMGVELVSEYINTSYSYESKNTRVAQLKDMDVKTMVMDLLVGIAYFQRPSCLSVSPRSWQPGSSSTTAPRPLPRSRSCAQSCARPMPSTSTSPPRWPAWCWCRASH